MDRTLTTAATGLTAQQRYVEIISNNLANVNTTGYKKVRPEFQDLLYQSVRAAGNTLRTGVEPVNELQIGVGTELVATTREHIQGDIQATGSRYHMAVKGEGFFVIRRPDNTFAYTRDGSFQIDRLGQIVTSQGNMLEPGLTIPEDAVEVQISRDGVVTAYMSANSQEPQVVGQIELARFINPAGLRALGDNLYVDTTASGAPIFQQPGTNNTGEIVQGHLENSNVDLVTEMVNMIVAQRSYELNSKSVKTAEEILQMAANLKR